MQSNGLTELPRLALRQVLLDDSRVAPAAAGGGAELDDEALRALAQDALCKVERAAASLRRAVPFAAARGGGGSGGGGREADGGAALMAVLRIALPALLAHFEVAARRVGATEDTLDIDPAADGALPDPVLSDILITIAAIFERLFSCQAQPCCETMRVASDDMKIAFNIRARDISSKIIK